MPENLLIKWKAVKADLRRIIGNEGKIQFQNNFRSMSFFGTPWPERKDKKSGPRYGRSATSGRALLVKTSRLKRSIIYRTIDENTIRFTSDVPYAKRHNDGLDGMPKRQFMGDHPKLRKILKQKLELRIKRAFK